VRSVVVTDLRGATVPISCHNPDGLMNGYD
jgi:hypothetical protein